MQYSLPTFNIRINVWTGTDTTVPPRTTDVPANLAWGKRTAVPSTGGTGSIGVPLMTMTLLAPAGTDLRGQDQAGGSDTVEVPAGSSRYYLVIFADYIGYGFANAHKAAILQHTNPFKTPDT